MNLKCKPDKELRSIFKRYSINWGTYNPRYCSLKSVTKRIKSLFRELIDQYGEDIILVGNKESLKFVKAVGMIAHFYEENGWNEFDLIWGDTVGKVIVLATSYEMKEKWEYYLSKKNVQYYNIYTMLFQSNIGINWHFYLLCTSLAEQLKYISPKECIRNMFYKLGYYAQFSKFIRSILIKFKDGRFYTGGAGELLYGKNYSPISMLRFIMEKDAYINSTNNSEKEKSLEKIIIYLLIMRDFKTAFAWIDEYINKRFRYYERYIDLKFEVIELLKRIKEYQDRNEQKNIIINWVDNISIETLKDYPYIIEEGKRGIFFENTFSSMPWTSWVMKTIFSRKNAISGKLFLTGKIDENNGFPLLGLMKKEGYCFKYAGVRAAKRWFKKAYLLKLEYFDDARVSTRSQWYAVDYMLRHKRKTCFMLHSTQESHYPFVCPNNTKISYLFSDKYADYKQKKESNQYWNDELQWYGQYYGKNCIKIYMGDHGDRSICENGNITTRYDYTEARTHVFAILVGNGISPRVEQRFFTFSRFHELLIYALNPTAKNYANIFVEQIDYEMYDKYKLDVEMQNYMHNLTTKFSVESWMQCRGVRTFADKYIRFIDGTELYFVLPDETKNEINNPEYQQRIRSLQKYVISKGYIDIRDYDFFKDVRILYEVYEKSRRISLKEMHKAIDDVRKNNV